MIGGYTGEFSARGGVMRILVFHSYLLRGTGGNIYNAELARALVGLGHEVHLLCQDAGAGELDFVDAVGRWHGGRLQVEVLRRPVRCTAYIPDIGGLLPVYVVDPYEGFDVRAYPELSDAELDHYLDANVAAVRDVAATAGPDAALANHLVMGPVILARALGRSVPYAIKIHGSALQYVVRPHYARFGRFALEGLAGAKAVLVGSRHVAESLWDTVAQEGLHDRTRMLPPGVDVSAFRPLPPAQARRRLAALASRLTGQQLSWGGEEGAARALLAADPGHDQLVTYVGKLTYWKGVDLLVAAWPLVVARAPDARLLIAGFGTFREALGQLARALARGDLTAARAIASHGREMQGAVPGELAYLAAFFDSLHGAEREEYLRAAPRAMERLHFTGRIDHGDIPGLMGASLAVAVPSTFPEAFGMVVAEAACCGALPVSADHSGLKEVSALLAPALADDLADLLVFGLGPDAVRELACRLTRWLTLAAQAPGARQQASARLAGLARSQFGWERVAEGVIAGAQGRLAELPPVLAGAVRRHPG